MKIKDKREFKRLSKANQLGNRFRTFPTVEAAVASGVDMFYIRGPVAQWQHMVTWVPAVHLESVVQGIEAKGPYRRDMEFVEVPHPSCYRSINAEATRDDHWLTLTYGTSLSLSLREDIEENGVTAHGLKAWHIFQQRVPPEDVEMLCEIWDRYPDSIIEFSTYLGQHVGIMRRSTIIWEVRNF